MQGDLQVYARLSTGVLLNPTTYQLSESARYEFSRVEICKKLLFCRSAS